MCKLHVDKGSGLVGQHSTFLLSQSYLKRQPKSSKDNIRKRKKQHADIDMAHYDFVCVTLININRPGVAGAVLKIPLLTDSLTESPSPPNLPNIITPKLRVTCHMSCVTCHV